MKNQEPRYISQGVDYLGFLSQQIGDLRGPKTLAYELIQNADDAKDHSGQFVATRITFDIRDDALIVSNDAVFREIDFERIRKIASASKRNEEGDRTTGAFGVGFISVYQISDRPEIHSAGRRWIIRPEKEESKRIEEYRDLSTDEKYGTIFRFPWAFEESEVRKELRVSSINKKGIRSFRQELNSSLPKAILFLKRLEEIELLSNGECILKVRREFDKRTQVNNILVYQDDQSRAWRILKGSFDNKGQELKRRFHNSIDDNCATFIEIAFPESLIGDGLLFATLPTDQSTGLPFHINADFFPTSDRKSIAFEDSHDPRSEWNRAAIQEAASVIKDNLIPLRDMFRKSPEDFWAIIEQIHTIYKENSGSNRIPLGVFWENLKTPLQNNPVVYTETNKWLEPIEIRLALSSKEEEAIPILKDLGIDLVHQKLRRYYNTLTEIGVKRLSIEDIYRVLQQNGLVERPVPFPAYLQNRQLLDIDRLDILWRGIQGIFERLSSKQQKVAKEWLQNCTLAPGIDGRIWPCRYVYQVSAPTFEIFAPLLSESFTFLQRDVSARILSKEDSSVHLLEQLCPCFDTAQAICLLESIDPGRIRMDWTEGEFNPTRIIQWFERHKDKLTDNLRKRLIKLPIFPSTQGLHPLEDLWIPGGFIDPIGVAGLLDMRKLKGLSDFLIDLGAKKLTFEDYTRHYIMEAFSNSETSSEVKYRLLSLLEKRIGEIRDNEHLKSELVRENIIECTDGIFRQPSIVYFPIREIKSLLGSNVNYTRLPKEGAESRKDLYKWLGVRNRPSTGDVLWILDKLVDSNKPDEKAIEELTRIIDRLGQSWDSFNSTEKKELSSLKSQEWLPAEGNSVKWFNPKRLYAGFQRRLFESQVLFLNIPIDIQNRIRKFLKYLEIGFCPQPAQVISYLRECSQGNKRPPNDIYIWLNNHIKDLRLEDVNLLKSFACLWIKDQYRRPDKVFLGNHPFGRFRFQLVGDKLSHFSMLLRALDIKLSPDYRDAFEVLKDISQEAKNVTLTLEDRDVVLECWSILSRSLEQGELDENTVKDELHRVASIPNGQGILHKPSRLFFEDRPELKEKFHDQLMDNCISRIVEVWRGMEAAGVSMLSSVVRGFVLDDGIMLYEDSTIKERIIQRGSLIETILKEVPDRISINSIRLLRVNRLRICWQLRAYNREWSTEPSNSISAHYEYEKKAIYFVSNHSGSLPWAAIARELTHALAPRKEISTVSPGLKIILEADTYESAYDQLIDLGIVPMEELGKLPSRGDSAEAFDEESISYDADGTDDIQNVDTSAAEDDPQAMPADPLPRTVQQEVPFAKKFYKAQRTSTFGTSDSPIVFPGEGPNTEASARKHTKKSVQSGRAGTHGYKLSDQWMPTKASKELADRFRNMAHGDYGKRCQICGRTFRTSTGQLQVFVLHVVPPGEDSRTNHYGDLLALCGWHYALVMYRSEWVFVDPETGQPFSDSSEREGWEYMKDSILKASQCTDDENNSYFPVPIRFSNIYQDWEPGPTQIYEIIRYSIPHWTYLCELLST